TLHATTNSRSAACPSCGAVSASVHSRYLRRLDEAAAAGRQVVVELQVRRFRCRQPGCPKATFAEQVPGLTFRHGRRSQGLQAALQRVALMLAGRAGARLTDALATPVSRSTLLRLIRAVPENASATPRVLGIDEFALRKGHVYATVLVDIETRRVVELLPDRSVETVSAWLAGHPGVEVICRDRSASFGEAGRLGAPEAIHVADRYHLWHNLAEAVEKTVVQHRALLPEPAPEPDPTQPPPTVSMPSLAAPPRTTGRLAERVREQHAAIHALLTTGTGLKTIARQLGLARNTVRRYAQAAGPDELLVGQWTGRASILDPFKQHIDQRFAEGCTNARRLFEEIQQRGYPGKEQIVRKYVHQLRLAFPRQNPPRRQPSVRDVTGWITRHPDRIDADDAQRLKEILTRVPGLAATVRHVRDFAELMNNRRGRHLKKWIAAVQADQIPALNTFAAGLLQDLDAVTHGLTLNYSSGAVEGHNNKIKMLKRQMFGRASFDLLRKRVLHAV
ncbi:ISL3 family transposase, partial [Streptomyces sp. NPDC048479]|uniref:ISL3 family transposase n=1 Tax=Streptomyces sp. NPDC048479 TaxID=3154725 RepID=UPI0034168951